MSEYAKIEFGKAALVDRTDTPIPEDLRKRIGERMDELIMRAAFGGRGYEPTTLYVNKYGRYSTVNPREQEALLRRNRAPFGLTVSS